MSTSAYSKTQPTPVASGPSVGFTPAGQLGANRAHVLEHAAARPVDVGAVLEDDVDERHPEHRLAAHRLHLGRGDQRGRDRVGDLVLDQIGALPHPLGEDDHLHVGEIRDGVERRALQRDPAPRRERGHEQDREERVARARRDQARDDAVLAGLVARAGGCSRLGSARRRDQVHAANRAFAGRGAASPPGASGRCRRAAGAAGL